MKDEGFIREHSNCVGELGRDAELEAGLTKKREIAMKTLRTTILTVCATLFAVGGLSAQDLSKYRDFSFGMSLTEVLKVTNRNLSEIKTKIQRPGLIQELNWWPPSAPTGAYQADSAQQILLSFYNGELYKIQVTYEASAVKGLTPEDMVQSLSGRYGEATTTLKKNGTAADESYAQQAVATWEDSDYSVKLIHSVFSGSYGLTLFSKHANAKAETDSVEATKLEAAERPQKEADERRKEADNLEIERQKNKKSFRP